MKKQIALIALTFIGSVIISQNKKYEEQMKNNVAQMDTARSKSHVQKITNNFERIAGAEKKEWLPQYYTALGYIKLAYEESGEAVDVFCDKAEMFVKAAEELKKDNDEIIVLKAMIASARISVNPMVRGQQYAALSASLLEKAKKINPENPRAYLQQGLGIYFTPEMFGGGKAKAKPIIEAANEKFKTFKPKADLEPNWGAPTANYFLNEINK